MGRPSTPLDPAAIAAADEALYRRYLDEPRPNALYDSGGNRIPVDTSQPGQAPLRDEWTQAYADNGGQLEDDQESPNAAQSSIHACPLEDDTSTPVPEPEPEPESPPPALGELIVNTLSMSVCWNTGPEGFDAQDAPLARVQVDIGGPGGRRSQTSDKQGQAVFDKLQPGEWRIEGALEDFERPTGEADTITTKVEAERTTEVDYLLKQEGLECERKHATQPAAGSTGKSLGPLFWSGEPLILVARDGLYVAMILGVVGGALWSLGTPPPGQMLGSGGQTLTVVCLAFAGYLTNMIFGKSAGVPLIAAAFALFLASFLLGMVPSIGLFAPPDVWGLPVSAATWAGFGVGIAPGRRMVYQAKRPAGPVVQPTLVAAATVIAVFIFVALANPPFADGTAGWQQALAITGVVVLGTLCGGVAGLLGCAFVNEGLTYIAALSADTTGYANYEDFLLPYAGERYCVQGHRGFASHFNSKNNDQEGAIDWSLPEGAALLATKEGHIVAYKETLHGNNRPFSNGNEDPNFIAIRHRDGTISKYLHLQKGAVSRVIPQIANCVSTIVDENQFGAGTIDSNPLHVHVGQVIGLTGDVGISMFSHLHYYVQLSASDKTHLALDFCDADVQRHKGRCWSMRKYRSSNSDRGAVQVPPTT